MRVIEDEAAVPERRGTARWRRVAGRVLRRELAVGVAAGTVAYWTATALYVLSRAVGA